MNEAFYDQVRIELVRGNIVEQKADALVNAANAHLCGGGGVDGAIHLAGGPSIMEETKKKYPQGCPTGSAVATKGGDLHTKYIFHAVAPCYLPEKTNNAELLISAYNSCLTLAQEKKCHSVVFPSLGTGAYHYPLDEATAIALTTVKQFLDSNRDHELKLIRFVLFDDKTFNAFFLELRSVFPPPWRHEETANHAAADYGAVEEVRRYDERMRSIRDIDGENQNLLSRLVLPPESTILEIGTGTGAFAGAAAVHYQKVIAADVSPVMLKYAQKKASEQELKNIEFVPAGFLSLELPEKSCDAVVTSLALHHLDDVWKAEAIARIYRWLKPGGILLLVDIVFDCKGGDLDDYLARELAPVLDENVRNSLYAHIRDEYSTFQWIMDGILEQAGFQIVTKEKFGFIPHLYLCKKPVDTTTNNTTTNNTTTNNTTTNKIIKDVK